MSTSSSLTAEGDVPQSPLTETETPPISPKEKGIESPRLQPPQSEQIPPPPPPPPRPQVGINQNPTAAALPGFTVPQGPPTLRSKVTQTLLMAPLYPMKFVHVLIQLGYEPVEPERRYSIVFQRYMYYWPGVIGYARAIARRDGWRELYRGVTGNFLTEVITVCAGSLLSPLIGNLVEKIPLSVVPSNGDTPDNEDNIDTTRAILVRGVQLFCRQLLLRSTVEIIRQPLITIHVRMIAQHVGKETLYNNVWSALSEIYRREGVAGFYKGVVPTILGVVLSTVMHVTLWVGLELIAKMITQDVGKTMVRSIIRPFMISYIPRSYSYPFELMRTVMAANDSGLKIGMEPHVPRFTNWTECYRHLKSQRAMYRGSVFFLPRYAYTTKQS